MVEKQNEASKASCQEQGCPGSNRGGIRGWLIGSIPFVVGLVLALGFGWCMYPELMFGKNEQPVVFSHQTHLVKVGMACTDCHTLQADGAFRGQPSTADCAVCHSEMQGTTQAEKDFIDNYVKQGKDLPWLAYQKQPANAYFSHAAHSVENCNTCHDFATAELCSLCHIDVVHTEALPPMRENRLTGYSMTTMKMNRCERCHAHPVHLSDATEANNACFVCHK